METANHRFSLVTEGTNHNFSAMADMWEKATGHRELRVVPSYVIPEAWLFVSDNDHVAELTEALRDFGATSLPVVILDATHRIFYMYDTLAEAQRYDWAEALALIPLN